MVQGNRRRARRLNASSKFEPVIHPRDRPHCQPARALVPSLSAAAWQSREYESHLTLSQVPVCNPTLQ